MFKTSLQALMGRSTRSPYKKEKTPLGSQCINRSQTDNFASTFLKVKSSVNHRKRAEDHKLKMVNISMAIALPLYIYPAPNVWQPLVDSIAANPTTSFGLIINPYNGPGEGVYPDANYISSIAELNSYNNVVLYGYVYTSWGARDALEVQADISTYQGWSNYSAGDIHVDGIFMDEAPSNTNYLAYMASLSQYTKQVMTNGNSVCFNPGNPIDAAFYQYADSVMAFENTYEVWTTKGVDSIPAALRSKSTVLIHNYTASDDQLMTDTASLKDAGYYSALITSESGYEAFSSTWAKFAADVGGAGTNSTDGSTPAEAVAASSSSSTTSPSSSSSSILASSTAKPTTTTTTTTTKLSSTSTTTKTITASSVKSSTSISPSKSSSVKATSSSRKVTTSSTSKPITSR